MSQTSSQNFPLSHLDFKSDLSKEILKSTTLETMLEQHEETLTRLKVNLRRQSRLEDELEQSKRLIEDLKAQVHGQQDFKSVEFEKQQLLTERLMNLQSENEQLSLRINLQNEELQKLREDQQRNKKYQEKIKTEVRPYIEELKTFSSQLEQKNKTLEAQVLSYEIQKKELQTQMEELAKNLKLQFDSQKNEQQELILSYEAEIQYASAISKDLHEQLNALTEKNRKLMNAFDRQIEVENQLIETQRLFETQKKSYEEEILRLQTEQNAIHANNTRLQLEKDDYQQRIVLDTQQIDALQIKNADLSTQLESLRFMWSAKNEETERLKMAMESLEKLNLELSSKIQESRQPTQST